MNDSDPNDPNDPKDDVELSEFEREFLDAIGLGDARVINVRRVGPYAKHPDPDDFGPMPGGDPKDADDDDDRSPELQAIQDQAELQEVVLEIVNGYRQRIASAGHYDGAMADTMLMQYHAHLLHLMSH